MVDLLVSTGRLLAAFFLVFLNGFFVAAEFAFVRVRSTAVDQLVEEGRSGAPLLQEIMGNLDDYLAVTQLGITIASLGLGWIGEPAVAALIEPVLEPLLPASAIHLVAFGVGFGFITFLHVVFGELAPKTIAIQRAEQLSLFVAPPMKFFYYLFVPGIVVFNGTANFFTRLVGIPPASETDETLQEEELLMLLTRSGKEGDVDMEEVEMIERVFELDDITVREVMVPRPDVVSVPADLPLADLRSVILEEGHTRYPVVDADEGDQVVGFVDVKDVIRASESGRADSGTVTAEDLAREIQFVPETTRINDLLLEFQKGRSQMAAVIDEWGAFEGLATVEDVVEVVVGDLRDEFDADEREPGIRRRDDGTYAVDGSVPISQLNESLEVEFRSEGFETVAGLVLDRLGRAPEAGDVVEANGYRFEVTRVDGARISTVAVRGADGERPEREGTRGTDAPGE
ncbi:hemolysin family protein [Halorarum salinum]|uniref:HlyC/CorC family transporter n=1 Tax=Halorarum salinum TaxID=2743089 RepID=A0A7D5QAG4_9EURY|nr:hemolysin family protein [Halobaculum salinum]QLG61439.1 HlyC/CorC family transporter [Halobaculum salinum]